MNLLVGSSTVSTESPTDRDPRTETVGESFIETFWRNWRSSDSKKWYMLRVKYVVKMW